MEEMDDAAGLNELAVEKTQYSNTPKQPAPSWKHPDERLKLAQRSCPGSTKLTLTWRPSPGLDSTGTSEGNGAASPRRARPPASTEMK